MKKEDALKAAQMAKDIERLERTIEGWRMTSCWDMLYTRVLHETIEGNTYEIPDRFTLSVVKNVVIEDLSRTLHRLREQLDSI